jgi:hypothetical protein
METVDHHMSLAIVFISSCIPLRWPLKIFELFEAAEECCLSNHNPQRWSGRLSGLLTQVDHSIRTIVRE